MGRYANNDLIAPFFVRVCCAMRSNFSWKRTKGQVGPNLLFEGDIEYMLVLQKASSYVNKMDPRS